MESKDINIENMPIVLIVNKLHSGGAERAVASLANAWADQGKEVHIVLISPLLVKKEAEYKVSESIRRHYFGRGHWLRGLLDRLPLLERINQRLWSIFGNKLLPMGKWGEAIVYAATRLRYHSDATKLRLLLNKIQAPVVFVFVAALFPIALLACEGTSIRLVAMERNDPGLDNVSAEIRLFRPVAYQRASLITANSRTALQTIAKFATQTKLSYIPNFLYNNEMLYTKVSTDERKPIILIVARLVGQKNHDLLLRAFAMLPPELQEWRLAIVGDGKERKALMQLATQLQISARIDWHGYTPNPYSFYRSASIFVLPSSYEGQSNSVLEAMSLELPVIVSDTPTLVEMVEHMQSGLVVPCDTVEPLAQAIIQLATNPELRSRLGNGAREYALTHDLAAVLPQWDQLLARALRLD